MEISTEKKKIILSSRKSKRGRKTHNIKGRVLSDKDEQLQKLLNYFPCKTCGFFIFYY